MSDLSPQVGVAGAPPDAVKQPDPHILAVRPFVRVSICSSMVPGDPTDKDRWYRFIAGCPIGDKDTLDGDGASSAITIQDGANRRTLQGNCGLTYVTASDSLGGQACTLRMSPLGTGELLSRRIRAFDRIRVEVVHPAVPGATTSPRWCVFDGLVRSVRGSFTAGAGFSSSVSINGAGLAYILSGAIYNWQQQIHPDATVMAKLSEILLAEHIGKVSAPPHDIIRAFILGALGTTMSLRVGDEDAPDGLPILDYFQFGAGAEWSTATFNKRALCYPCPWNLIQQASGSSAWSLIQAVSEPLWHEVFVGYRGIGGATRPALVHRPRPFPGSPDFDHHWSSLPVRKLGAWPTPGFMDVSEEVNADRRPNCFHWAGLSLGDQSRELEYMKLALGFATSDIMVNRFGYSSMGLHSKLAPIAQGSSAPDLYEFARTGLEHYARQEVALPYLKSQTIGGTFIPVRPGDVLENHAFGDAPADISTGYVTSTSFALHSSPSGFSLSMSAELDRVVRGTDAKGYPEKVRALVSDLKFVAYAGQGIGANRKPPRFDADYKAPKPEAVGRVDAPSDLVPAIKAAASRHGVPPWLIAHVLHNETGLGRNLGGPSTRRNGIAQITGIATTALIEAGHLNPDGSAFQASDKGDRVKSVHACAAMLKLVKADLTGRGMPSSAQSFWSWVARGYRWGAASTADLGAATGWKWPAGGEGFPDYQRYWSPEGIAKGQRLWGYLG